MTLHRPLLAVLATGACIIATLATAGQTAPSPTPSAAMEALRRLEEGHQRFLKGELLRPRVDASRIRETAENGQKPFVTVLTCSDSRLPVETIFDQGIGDIFVVRVAGNVADTDQIGTAEYGTHHLGTPLLLVLGHTKCGAVQAVCDGAKVGGSIPQLVDNIQPAMAACKKKHPGATGADLVRHTIDENVFVSMRDLVANSHDIAHLVKEGKLKVIGAVYDIATGDVTWLGEHPMQDELVRKGLAHHGMVASKTKAHTQTKAHTKAHTKH